VQMLHHILTTQMEPRGLIKLSASNQVVCTEISLCLSFYLRCSLGGYMLRTTAGFSIEIVEALAPQPHHRIPLKCPQ
jgi:hypothetical protein